MSELSGAIRLDQVTWWSDGGFRIRWNQRWSAANADDLALVLSPDIRRHYICGIFDALLGVWQARGRCPFHLGAMDKGWVTMEAAVPRCINSGLYFWEKPCLRDAHPEPSTSVSLQFLDALLIERRGPFRFAVTDRIEDHLTINENRQILICNNWRNLLMLRHHKVLVDDSKPMHAEDTISRFQLLSRSSRSPEERRKGEGVDVRFVAYELLHTYVLLFYRPSYRNAVWEDAHVLAVLGSAKSSPEIAELLPLGLTHWVKETIVRMYSGNELPESRDFLIFRQRLEDLQKSLAGWKATRFHHLVYRGYGEADPVALYGFYVALYFYPLVILGFLMSIIQTVLSGLALS